MLHCREVKGKHNSTAPSLQLVATRVPPETKEKFEKLAAQNLRSVTAHLRFLIEEHLDKEAA
jgi:predicted DNA-binding protein